jgi:hypothetical protein
VERSGTSSPVTLCQNRLKDLGWTPTSEHCETKDGQPGLIWIVACARDGDEFVASGESPSEAYWNAVGHAESLSRRNRP